MTDKQLLEQLQNLKKVTPSDEQVDSARQTLMAHIEEASQAEQAVPSKWETLLAKPRFAMVATFGVIMLLAVGTGMAQNSLPGSTLYPVKIASEEARKATKLDPLAAANFSAALAERRVDEVSRLAEVSLEEEEASDIIAYLENNKREIEEARTSGDEEVIEQKVAQVNERVEELKTSVTSDAEERRERVAQINASIDEALSECSDEALVEEIKELKEEGGIANTIKAFELSSRCESVQDETENSEESEEATTTPSGSGTTTETGN